MRRDRGLSVTDALGAMLDGLRVAHGSNELLTTDTGETYIDLFCGSGAVLLGHSNPVILAGLQEQLGDRSVKRRS